MNDVRSACTVNRIRAAVPAASSTRTQSESTRVLTLGPWDFQGQFRTNVPGLLAAVTLSVVPVFVLYLIGRRHLLSGLTAGFGK